VAVFVVTYDLRSPGRDYTALWDQLRKVGAVRALESVWLLETSQSATEVRDALISWMDANDRLLVVEITAHAAWAGTLMMNPSGEWLLRKRP
jgi:hypothetical protein